jgi:excinuclease UvrABC nuclease subunit
MEISAGTIIYVGKALNLNNRVRSDFHALLLRDVLHTIEGYSLINL